MFTSLYHTKLKQILLICIEIARKFLFFCSHVVEEIGETTQAANVHSPFNCFVDNIINGEILVDIIVMMNFLAEKIMNFHMSGKVLLIIKSIV